MSAAMLFEQSHQQAAKTIWLLLLKEGGWWTVHEMFKHLGVEPHDRTGRRVINAVVGSMTRGQQIEQRYTEQPRAQYAVLPGCKIPIGLTVGEVQL